MTEGNIKIQKTAVVIIGILLVLVFVNANSLSFPSFPTKVAPANQNSIQSSTIENNIQVIKMEVTSYGYQPASFILKKDVPVRWEVTANELNGCNGAIISPDYNINVQLRQGQNIIEFTPNKEGAVAFSCRMGMLRGKFIVTQTGTATQEQTNAVPTSGVKNSCGASGGCGCGG